MTPTSSGRSHCETDGLTKRFGERVVVDDVTVEVPRATAFGFLGHNGAGKTTLIRMLLGLTPATAGSARVLGPPAPARRSGGARPGRGDRRAAVCAIRSWRSYEPSRRRGSQRRRTRTDCRGVLAQDQPGGPGPRPRRRVLVRDAAAAEASARWLMTDPELLILDRADERARPWSDVLEMRQMIRELVDEEGRTMFISSHLLDGVEKVLRSGGDHRRGQGDRAAGTIAELVSENGAQLVIGCDDSDHGSGALAEHTSVIRG